MFDHRQQILDKGGVCYELLGLLLLRFIENVGSTYHFFFGLLVSIVKFVRSADSSRSDLY